MEIAIIDAQGAGIGQSVIKEIRKTLGSRIYIFALGTNPTATSNMIKSGANLGITGESNICNFCNTCNIHSIVGPIGIVCSGGINGEITTSISESIFNMDCIKYIIPLQKHGIYIPGTRSMSIKDIINEIILDIDKALK